jgi:hypothetical protein
MLARLLNFDALLKPSLLAQGREGLYEFRFIAGFM